MLNLTQMAQECCKKYKNCTCFSVLDNYNVMWMIDETRLEQVQYVNIRRCSWH